MNSNCFRLGAVTLCAALFLPALGAEPVKTDLFVSGQGGYAFYRIPGIVVTARGTALAYCEARRDSQSDWSTMDVLLRRSTDGGRTWGAPQRISTVPNPSPENPLAAAAKAGLPAGPTYNNPIAIAVRDGTVHFLFCLEYMRCFYLRSTDDGLTFSAPVEITNVFAGWRPGYDWKILSVGPGHGIELRNGRLLATVRLALGSAERLLRPTVATTIFSDDGGRTWQRGDLAVRNTPETVNPNEPLVAELSDGRVMMNLRNESAPKRRLVTVSPDGATRWSAPRFDPALLDSGMMASLLRVPPPAGESRPHLLFANTDDEKVRRNLTIKLSRDDGATWPVQRTIEPGPSAYCDLAALPGGDILCFYERGSDDGKLLYGRLTVARLSPGWLTSGR